MTGKV